MERTQFLEITRGGIIVSCQVKPDDPLYLDGIVAKLAQCAIWGGAKGLRLNTPPDIAAVRAITDLPIIGLWKDHTKGSDVFITPTLRHVEAVLEAGADVVAVDATDRLNADGQKAYTLITEIRRVFGDVLILADIRNAEEAARALAEGADMAAPTLYRFNEHPKSTEEPDFGELTNILKACQGLGPVLMEGKINTPEQAMESLYLGAHAVIVGSAITRPHLTTMRFVNKVNGNVNGMPLYY